MALRKVIHVLFSTCVDHVCCRELVVPQQHTNNHPCFNSLVVFAQLRCLLGFRWHYVEQRACSEQGWCIAVNYWYDMIFDSRYAAYKMVESLAQQVGLAPPAPEEGDDKDTWE